MVGRNHITTLLLAYALVGGFMFAFAIVATTETETSAKPIEFFIAPMAVMITPALRKDRLPPLKEPKRQSAK